MGGSDSGADCSPARREATHRASAAHYADGSANGYGATNALSAVAAKVSSGRQGAFAAEQGGVGMPKNYVGSYGGN